jgi:hypothetical protein
MVVHQKVVIKVASRREYEVSLTQNCELSSRRVHISASSPPPFGMSEAALSLEACSLRDLQDSTEWVDSSPRLERCDIEIMSAGVVRQHDVRRL